MRIFYNPAHHWVTRAAICLDFFAAGVVRRGVWFFSISFVVPCQRQMVHRDGRTDASENKGKKRNESNQRIVIGDVRARRRRVRFFSSCSSHSRAYYLSSVSDDGVLGHLLLSPNAVTPA
jgi:hypothetical protein